MKRRAFLKGLGGLVAVGAVKPEPQACVHPLANVQRVFSESDCCYDCDPPELYFAWCDACDAVVEGEIPNPIPHYWESEAIEIAQRLTGYPVKEPPKPTQYPHGTSLGGILNSTYDRYVIEELQNLDVPILRTREYSFPVKFTGVSSTSSVSLAQEMQRKVNDVSRRAMDFAIMRLRKR